MSGLKPGDKVWIPATASIVFPSGDVWFSDRRGFHIEWAESSIPDAPNLAAVARVIAAHPDGFMALGRVVSNIESDQKGESEGVWDYNDAELGFLRALAAALNGGTE